ncbi:MAG: histidine--tRNA ligase [Patescibacteria group bacterium]|nr:histidine--tRNA ligase [Patescibacteria group bacterium]
MNKLETLPYRGARDFYPKDQKILNYIFNIWREAALESGFEEYNGPFLEPFDLYAAKSGEELVKEQLYSFEDRGGRKLAIRPEMTPTVARMIAAKSKSMIKPIKWFSIADFWRYEKPQRGRGREFFQLNADIFGENSVLSDFEVFTLGARIMEHLKAKPNMYEIRVNNRLFMDFALEKIVGFSSDRKSIVMRLIDKKNKMAPGEFEKALVDSAKATGTQVQKLNELLKFDLNNVRKLADENRGAKELTDFFELAKKSDYAEIFVYDPQIVRGLDYYTGLVIEQWDKNPKNNRSMYGGGRYDGLTDLFAGAEPLPATGFAMGDLTLINFLESWQLLPQFKNETAALVTVLAGFTQNSVSISETLRKSGIKTELYLNDGDGLDKQIGYANRKEIPFVLIIGEKEAKDGKVMVKNMATGEQTACGLTEMNQILDTLWKA